MKEKKKRGQTLFQSRGILVVKCRREGERFAVGEKKRPANRFSHMLTTQIYAKKKKSRGGEEKRGY